MGREHTKAAEPTTTVGPVESRPPDDVATIRDLLAEHLPDVVVDSVGFRGEGLENVAYDVNSEFILRISKEDDPVRRASLVAREAELLGSSPPSVAGADSRAGRRRRQRA